VKQILLAMNEKNPFVIDDLDDFHLVIKADEEYRVRSELEAEVWLLPLLRKVILCPFIAREEYVQPGIDSNGMHSLHTTNSTRFYRSKSML
jgi:TFIIH basal transcription factor complex TTD-A subunit